MFVVLVLRGQNTIYCISSCFLQLINRHSENQQHKPRNYDNQTDDEDVSDDDYDDCGNQIDGDDNDENDNEF